VVSITWRHLYTGQYGRVFKGEIYTDTSKILETSCFILRFRFTEYVSASFGRVSA